MTPVKFVIAKQPVTETVCVFEQVKKTKGNECRPGIYLREYSGDAPEEKHLQSNLPLISVLNRDRETNASTLMLLKAQSENNPDQ
ncbi:hypothetical protein ACFX2I_039758 [Malus domestica]